MIKTATLLVAIAASTLAPAKGQFLDLSHMVNANLAFDQAMMQQAANFSNAWLQARTEYRMRTGDWSYLPGPFTAMDLNRANNETAAAYSAYNDNWHRNSNAQLQAAGNFGHAMMGTWNYTNGSSVYTLPYSHNYQWVDQQGYVHGTNTYAPPGYSNWYQPLYPVQ